MKVKQLNKRGWVMARVGVFKRGWGGCAQQKRVGGLVRAFTLIELMIVMAIIALLTVLALSNYASVQAAARLDFATDALVASLREQMMLAKSGRTEDRKLQCFAVKFGGEGGFEVGSSEYKAVDGQKVDECDDVASWQQKDFVGNGVKMKVGEVGGSATHGFSVEIYFKPPFGKAVGKDNNVVTKSYQFQILSENSADSSPRYVCFDPQNQSAVGSKTACD